MVEIELMCERCGIKFLRSPCDIKNRKHHFCSKKCFDMWQCKDRNNKSKKPNNDTLYDLYVVKKYSTVTISNLYNCSVSTAWMWLKKAKIKIRSRDGASEIRFPHTSKPTQDQLYNWYVIEKYSTPDIAEITGYDKSAIYRFLVAEKIPIRKGHDRFTQRACKKISVFVKNNPIMDYPGAREKVSISAKNRKCKDSTKHKLSINASKRTGKKNPNWKGGQKLSWARQSNRKRKRGFILLTNNNPYNEPVDYHHIHSDLPYVVPCPTRIHKMFSGNEKTHNDNVNAMLGFRFEDGILIC